MAKYAEYIFNGTNYIQVSGPEEGSVSSRLIVNATGSPANLTLSSTFSDILSAAQSGVDVVIKYANSIHYLESFDSSFISFRRSDMFANMSDDDFESIEMEKIVVTSNSAKVENDTKMIPLVVTGHIITDETPAEGTYVDTDTTLFSLSVAIDSKMPIEIRVNDNHGLITCFYFYEKDDEGNISFGKYMDVSESGDSRFIYLTTYNLTNFSNNADGTLRCILRNHSTALPIIPPVTTADSGKFLRVNSSGKWAAETVPNAEGGTF